MTDQGLRELGAERSTPSPEPRADRLSNAAGIVLAVHPAGLAARDTATRARTALALQRTAGNAAVRRLARSPQQTALTNMRATKGYKALTKSEQARIDALIGGSTSLSEHAWSHMRSLLSDATQDKDLAATFRSFLSGTSWLNFDVRLPGEKRLKASKYTLDKPVAAPKHGYRSGKADAIKTVVHVSGVWPDGTKVTHSIPIYAPKKFTPPKKGRILPSAKEMAKVVAELPIQSRSRIKRIDLHPVPNPDDAHWQADPNYNPTGAEFVSHMTAGSDGIVDIFPSTANKRLTEIETSLIHETGHVVSNAKWGDDPADKRWKKWQKARKDDAISLSTYGNSSDQEDFAESWLLLTSSYGTPREAEVRLLIPNRCKLLDTFIQHPKAKPKAKKKKAAVK